VEREQATPPIATCNSAVFFFVCICFIDDRRKNIPIKLRKRPRGSDLNQPRFPLRIRGGLKAINNEEIRPAVEFHNVLTNR
jgi:hypothetical protein